MSQTREFGINYRLGKSVTFSNREDIKTEVIHQIAKRIHDGKGVYLVFGSKINIQHQMEEIDRPLTESMMPKINLLAQGQKSNASASKDGNFVAMTHGGAAQGSNTAPFTFNAGQEIKGDLMSPEAA